MSVAVRDRISHGARKSRDVLDRQKPGVFRRYAPSHFVQLTYVKIVLYRAQIALRLQFWPVTPFDILPAGVGLLGVSERLP
jgi:hypothetical protein